MNNYIHDNNLPNGAPGGLPAILPPGGGVMLLGVSDNILVGNRIENNDFFGLAVLDFCFALTGSSGPGRMVLSQPQLIPGKTLCRGTT